jgi:hypothetical protein
MLMHAQSLPTLLGSIGLISPPKGRTLPTTTATAKNSPPNNDDLDFVNESFASRMAAAAAAAQQQQQATSPTTLLTFDDAVARYDEAVAFCGPAMADCMEFFAMLDDDGDGVVDVGVLRAALCGGGGTTTSSKSTNARTTTAAPPLLTDAEFYFALDAARLLTGPKDIAASNFDDPTPSRLEMLRVDDDLHEEDALPPTATDAPLTGTIVPSGLTVYQFLNVILKFAL